ncbi:MAG TPA: radical SAM protein [Lacipirellula sp.]
MSRKVAGRKLLLVNPVNSAKVGFSINLSSRFPPLGLGIVAALTPPDWEVELIDENFDRFRYREADLVAITAFTSAANRAYEIASIYRREGVPVVMGGIHASMRPEEAAHYVDAVVTGEVESVWSRILADAVSGALQPMYYGQLLNVADCRRPRREIYSAGYQFATIQTSRGCPLDCDFCSVTAFNGRRYRRRPPDQVLDELETIEAGLLFFVDDNIIGYGAPSRDLALQIFRGIVERGINKHWFCQASVNIADDPEVLEWASRAGCRMIFLGIEAEDDAALAAVNKRLNRKRGADAYELIFRRIHQAGIAVLGAFIFGMDGDTPDKLFRRADYIIQSGVDVMQCTAMTPLPGTRLFANLRRQRRLLFENFPRDWDRYSLTEVVHQPLDLSADELSEVLRTCMKRIYAMPVLKAKANQTLRETGRWDATEFAWQSNLNYREIAVAPTTFAAASLA